MYFIVLIIILLIIDYTEEITINAISFVYGGNADLYPEIVNEFNKYSQKNDLDINLKLTILTTENSTIELTNYGSMIDMLLMKKSTKYDLYLYFDSYTSIYGPHFINLENILEEDYIKMFSPELLNIGCKYNNKIVGLPLFFSMDVLFSNTMLLNKYNRKVPETWDQLLETAKYIKEEEKKLNNTEIIGYNGLFSDDESGTLSLFEFFNSYRDSNYSPYPKVKSKETKDALIMIKKLKEEIASDDIFSRDMFYTIEQLFSNNALFLKFYYGEYMPFFEVSAIPGKNENVSGSIASPFVISVSRYSNKEKQEAAIKALLFFTSKDIQKRYFIKNYYLTGIDSLYDDEDVCKMVNCPAIKGAQPYSTTAYNVTEYSIDYYFAKLRQYSYEYIFGVIVKQYKPKYIFIRYDHWIISISGSFLLPLTIIRIYGKLNVMKCIIENAFFLTGYTLNWIPLINQLIVDFPKTNKISEWLNQTRNRYLFLISFIIFEMILHGCLLIFPYDIETILKSEGENFQKCKMNNVFGKYIHIIIKFIYFIFLLSSLLLIFIEWNMKETLHEIKILFSLNFINFLQFIINKIIQSMDLNNYYVDGILFSMNIFVLSITNYIHIFLLRYYSIFFENNKNSIESIIDHFKENNLRFSPDGTSYSISTENNSCTTQQNKTDNSSFDSSATQKRQSQSHNSKYCSGNVYPRKMSQILKYHYQQTKN
ncbi:periplasmic binding protein-like II [Neocallimastix californiae]|uniref:Periplasmic binding protein-like II n=1 Tax=Neocallimastix californiae TaxID=1754190 RepID=A0A1Y2A0K2_9FUNG|nr:periplasmic binding protein-like II [Neocallimastix californiae]|eukprot:ORY16051.1 periplasmic binding protein-like II [Neocallimastix californiae]